MASIPEGMLHWGVVVAIDFHQSEHPQSAPTVLGASGGGSI